MKELPELSKLDEKSKFVKAQGKRVGSIGRAGGERKLSPQPDQTVQAYVQVCAGCGREIGTKEQKIQQRYDINISIKYLIILAQIM